MGSAPLDPSGILDVCLGGHMDFCLGETPAHLGRQPPVLNDEGIGAQPHRTGGQRQSRWHFIVCHKHVHGHKDASPCHMSLLACLLKGGVIKVVCPTASVEVVTKPAVDGISPACQSRPKGRRTSGWSEQLADEILRQGYGFLGIHRRLGRRCLRSGCLRQAGPPCAFPPG